ncbi:hypothetical protein J0871_16725 [Salegentibacter sp. BDJ18]|uniref:hypothetical protein n=1 Tax=Salegentibacter sp. BDJ18 TaxID=2816376 RepID=UPI001AAEB14A|nr:hypothetical protein [Salegentibacter sp. BDJ18]MBO2546063.1 hypothetical protein [Salegentibacter sp. BDJ18]
MAKRKFFKQQTGEIDGPKKKLHFTHGEIEISEEEAKKILDDFFDLPEATNAKEMQERAWANIIIGKVVTLDDVSLSSSLK